MCCQRNYCPFLQFLVVHRTVSIDDRITVTLPGYRKRITFHLRHQIQMRAHILKTPIPPANNLRQLPYRLFIQFLRFLVRIFSLFHNIFKYFLLIPLCPRRECYRHITLTVGIPLEITSFHQQGTAAGSNPHAQTEHRSQKHNLQQDAVLRHIIIPDLYLYRHFRLQRLQFISKLPLMHVSLPVTPAPFLLPSALLLTQNIQSHPLKRPLSLFPP